MSLTLYYHPLSSFCQKAVIGLYELEVAFDKQLVRLEHEAERAAFLKVWPLGKFPVLRDAARAQTVPESSTLLEYAELYCAHGRRLTPLDPELARACRLRDRFYDLYVNMPVGKIVTDKLRPATSRDPVGVEQAKQQLATAYGIADSWFASESWAMGEIFTLADCAAAPALFYANKVSPFAAHRRLAAYYERLLTRPTFARVLEEAAPYLAMFPG